MKNLNKIIAALLVAVIIAVPLSSCDVGSGSGNVSATVVSHGDLQITGAMMNFFYNDYLQSWYDDNGAYMAYYSIDSAGDLKSQSFGGGYEKYFLGDFNGSWYDYFWRQTLDSVKLYVVYADYATKNNLSLGEEDVALVDEYMVSVAVTLKERGLDYESAYGKGVTEEVVRSCYEIMTLARKGAEHKESAIKEALEKDDSEIYAEAENNKEAYYSAKCLKYSIGLLSTDYELYMDFLSACNDLKARADGFRSAKTPEDFAAMIADRGDGNNQDVDTAKIISDYTENIAYEVDSELGNWLFVENAKINSVKVIENRINHSSNGNDYEEFTLDIYMVLAPAGLDKNHVANFAYLLADKEDYIKDFVNEFNSGAKSTVRFYEVAQEHYANISGYEKDPEFYYGYDCRIGYEYFGSRLDVLNAWIDRDDISDNTLSEMFTITIEDNDVKVEYDYSYSESYKDTVGSIEGSYVTGIFGSSGSEDGVVSITPGYTTVVPGAEGTVTLTPGTSVNGSVTTIVPGTSLNGSVTTIVPGAEGTVTLTPGTVLDKEYFGIYVPSIKVEVEIDYDAIVNRGGSYPQMNSGDTVYAVIFFDNYGNEIWYEQAMSAVLNSQFDSWYQSELERVSVDYDAFTVDVVAKSNITVIK